MVVGLRGGPQKKKKCLRILEWDPYTPKTGETLVFRPLRLNHKLAVALPGAECGLHFCPPAELPESEHISVAEATWLALNVVSGGGNASNSQPIGVTKIAKSVIAPLADHNISVFMLSTYQTDFILVSGRQVGDCKIGNVSGELMTINGNKPGLGMRRGLGPQGFGFESSLQTAFESSWSGTCSPTTSW